MYQVKAASIDITPPSPIPLAGFASRVERPFQSIHDRLELNALLIDDIVFLSFDTLSVGSRIDGAAKKLFGEKTVTLASHTHFAPALDRDLPLLGAVDDRYENFVLGQLQALKANLDAAEFQAVDIHLGQTHAEHAINRRRRAFGPDGKFTMRMLPNPKGYADQKMTVLALMNAAGRPLVLLWSYACHPVSFYDENAVSSDFVGVVRKALRDTYGDIPCVFAQGFCGDVRPPSYTPAGGKLVYILRRILQGPCFGVFTKSQYDDWSQTLAHHATGLRLKRREGSGLSWQALDIPLTDLQDTSIDRPGLTIRHVTLAGILDIWILSGEPVGQIAKLLPSTDIPRMTAGYSGHMFGYLPTTEILEEGGYEARGFRTAFSLPGEYRPDISAFLKQRLSSMAL